MKSFSVRLASGIAFSLLLCGAASAQYSGGTGTSAPSYGSGKAIAAGVGAAGAGAGILYLTLRHRNSLTGCIQGSGAALRLVDDKTHQSFSLLSGSTDLKSGERVELQGKRTKGEEGTQSFQVSKIVKNLGACSTE